MPKLLEKFLAENSDVSGFVRCRLQEEPWYKNKASNVIATIALEKFVRPSCQTCGKPLSIESVRRGAVFCSGGCKSRNSGKIQEQKEVRKQSEKIYFVDKSAPPDKSVADCFAENHNAPSAVVAEKIADYSKRDSKGIGLYRFLLSNPDVDKYLGNLAMVCDWIEDKKMAFWFAKRGLYEGKDCRTCGKKLSFEELRRGHDYCSVRCAQLNELTIERHRKTSEALYGTKHPMQSIKVKKKLTDTLLERYGVINPSLSPEIRERRRRTMVERYGVDAYTRTKEYLEKSKKTNADRYGVEWHLQSDAIKEKIARTNIEKYGVDNPFKNSEIKSRIRKKALGSFYDRMIEKYGKYVVPLFSKEEYEGMRGCRRYSWRCVKCGTVFEDYRHSTSSFRRMSFFPLCPNCYPPLAITSFKEKEVVDFIKSIYSGKVVENTREVISPLELDAYLPDKKIAVEFDGLYWHSEVNGKDIGYHLGKTIACETKGIRLLHVFEDEWIEKTAIVQDRIRASLGIYQRRIFARKCLVKTISAKVCSGFLEENHLQGDDRASIRYGLFLEEELVAVMTFKKPRFDKRHDWELTRYSSKIGTQVIGGASRLLAHFIKDHGGSIVSYADRRYSFGGLYEKIGFRKIGESAPNYWYIKGNVKLSRYQCQKHRLPKLLGEEYDDSLTELENMEKNGFSRVFDCGNLIYAYA